MKQLLLFIGIGLHSIGFSQCTINATTAGTTPQIDSAVNYTTEIWSQYLNSAVPIKINVYGASLTAFGPLAITFPNGELNYAGAPLNNLWYASCLANSITGTELNPGEADMDIFINLDVNYYYGTDGNPGGSQFDFVSVLLHEIAHGLGIASLCSFEAGVGSFGMIDSASIYPFQTSFSFPQLDSLPSVWDSYLVNSSGDYLIDTTLFPNISTTLGNEMQSNLVYFTGPQAALSNGGNNPRVFAPMNYEAGSSLQHFNESSFVPASGNGTMTPYIANSEVEHNPGPLLLNALVDIGWSVNVTAGIESLAVADVKVYPNPSVGTIYLHTEGIVKNLQVIDVTGQSVPVFFNPGNNQVDGLQSGVYIIRGTVEGKLFNERVIIQ